MRKQRRGFAVLTAMAMVVIIFTLVSLQLLRVRQDLGLGHFERVRTKKLFLARAVTSELLAELRETTNLPANIDRVEGEFRIQGTSEVHEGNSDVILLKGTVTSRGNPSASVNFHRIERRVNRHAAKLFVTVDEEEKPAEALPTVTTNDGPGTPWVAVPPIAVSQPEGGKIYPKTVATYAADWMATLYAVVPREENNSAAGGIILRIKEDEQENSAGQWETFGRIDLDLDSLGPVASDGVNFYVSSGPRVDQVHVVRATAPNNLEPIASPGGPIDSLFISTEIYPDGTPALVANIDGRLVYLQSPRSWLGLPPAPNMVHDDGGIMTRGDGMVPLEKTGGSGSAIFGLKIMEGVDSIFRFEKGDWKVQDPVDDYFMDGEILKRNDSYAVGASDLSVDRESGAVFVELTQDDGQEPILFPLFAQNPVENVPLEFYVQARPGQIPRKESFGGTTGNAHAIASGGEVDAGQIIFVSSGSH